MIDFFQRFSTWGRWDTGNGLEIFPIEKWDMRKDLTGVFFRTSSANDPPFVVTVRDLDLASPPPGYKECFVTMQ